MGNVKMIWAPTLKHPFQKTQFVGRAAGRWVSVAGYGLLIKDGFSIGRCAKRCEREKECN